MEWVEITGRTLAEAKDRALDRLGVDERDAEFEVLEEPRVGFLGRMKGEARVRARVRPTTPRPKLERRERRRRDGRGDRGGHREPVGDASQRAGGDAVEAEGDKAQAGEGPTRQGEPSAQVSGAGGTRRRRRRRRGSGAGRGGQRSGQESGAREIGETSDAAAHTTQDGSGIHPEPQERVEAMTEIPLERQAEIVHEFVEGLLDVFGLDGEVSSAVDEDAIEVRVDGDHLGLLVGPRGQTLQALSEVARSVVVRQAEGGAISRLTIDVAGYRERRRAALERFAAEVADRVRSTGAPVAMEPMAPPDRKVVHDVVNELEGVTTISEGEEPRRRVVIVPE